MITSIRENAALLADILKLVPPVLEITYESYLSDRSRVINDIFKTIEVPPAPLGEQVFSKITSDDLSEIITNYDTIRKFGQGIGCAV
jgi:hypothetical protein